MGELQFFLGLQVKQSLEEIFINQEKYVQELLKRFSFNQAKLTLTPMSTSIKLDADEKDKTVDAHQYRGMIGSLLYLIVSRPNI